MTRLSAHRLQAARGPDRGGALLRWWGALYCADYCDGFSSCTGAKAPARHAKGVPIMYGAPPVRRAVGRSRGGVQARLDSARGKLGLRRARDD